MKLSVVICTKNEERNILRCLNSIKKIADEIIILDSFSDDQTPQICKSFANVKFHQTQWLGFSKTKNKANELASGDYILSLDADEVLSEEIQDEILLLKPELKGIYRINRLTHYCGQWIRHSGWFPDLHERLFPKNQAGWSEHLVHEKLEFNTNLPVQNLKGVVYHYSIASQDEHLKKIQSYSSLAAQQLASRQRRFLPVAMIINPIFRFFRHFIIKRGFLDGIAGFKISLFSAYAVFLKYKKAWLLKQKTK